MRNQLTMSACLHSSLVRSYTSDRGRDIRSKRGQVESRIDKENCLIRENIWFFGNRCGFPRYRSKKECEFLVCVSRVRVVRQDHRPLLLIVCRPTNGLSVSRLLYSIFWGSSNPRFTMHVCDRTWCWWFEEKRLFGARAQEFIARERLLAFISLSDVACYCVRQLKTQKRWCSRYVLYSIGHLCYLPPPSHTMMKDRNNPAPLQEWELYMPRFLFLFDMSIYMWNILSTPSSRHSLALSSHDTDKVKRRRKHSAHPGYCKEQVFVACCWQRMLVRRL